MGLKVCLEDGCWNATMGSRCGACERRRQTRRNADPKRRAYADPAYRAVPLHGACVCCGATADLTRDHVVPLTWREPHDGNLLQLMCRPCNSSKQGRRMVDTTCPMHGGLVWRGGAPRGDE